MLFPRCLIHHTGSPIFPSWSKILCLVAYFAILNDLLIKKLQVKININESEHNIEVEPSSK